MLGYSGIYGDICRAIDIWKLKDESNIVHSIVTNHGSVWFVQVIEFRLVGICFIGPSRCTRYAPYRNNEGVMNEGLLVLLCWAGVGEWNGYGKCDKPGVLKGCVFGSVLGCVLGWVGGLLSTRNCRKKR